MAQQVSWHGTQQELFELSSAVSAHCSCRYDRGGQRLSTCASHHMLTREQRSLNGLLFARRIAARLRTEEFHPAQSEVAFTS